MLGTLRRSVAVILTLATAAPLGAQAGDRAARTGANPQLVVFIAVDQMRADYFERFLPQLQGGLGRLYRGGAVFTNAYQDHAITETAPGHSVMLSGRFPAHTGIVTNSRGVPDPQAPLIGGGGAGASPFRFRGSVLIDWMRQRDPRSRALSVSRKDRGAILPLGRAHQHAFWYADDGRFTTSTYYADTLPTWVQRFNARNSVQGYAGAIWPLLLPESSYPEVDSVPQENGGRGYTFPHGFSSDSATLARNFSAYPAMDSLTAQLALAGVAAMDLGRGPQTDLLSVSFSTTDAVGHAFGPDSRELHDQIVRLDRYLGTFIDSLYKIRDSTTIIFALTADHGVQPNPEVHAAATHTAAVRAPATAAIRATNQTLRAAGASRDAVDFEEGIVTLDRAALSGTRLRADSVIDALERTLRAVPGVARVDRVRDLARADTTRDAVARRWVHMLPSDFSADLVVSLAPFAYYAGNTVATHGSPNDLDAHVPEIFYGPWFRAGRYSQRALAADVAPTLAAVLGITPTEPLDGRAHTDAIRRP
jgi:predicted AlkP superfamily pyrophosphatase or phosphodiesterase